MKSPALSRIETEMENFARYFSKRYFGKVLEENYWIADVIGGTYVIADYFFNFEEMVDFVRYQYSSKAMFDYYDYRMKDPEVVICIRDYKKLE